MTDSHGKRWTDWGWTIARCLFGLVFIALTLLVLIEFGDTQPPAGGPAANDFLEALNRSGFINPLLTGSLLVGGAAMMIDRWAPLGLLLLAPSVVVIACFHWVLTHSYIWGSIWPIWWVILAWHYRHVFARLWERKAPD